MLDVNAFEIRGNIRGLFPFTAMMNASCSPNTQNSIDRDWMCRVRAVRDIAKGEEITDTYTYTLSNTLYRRKHLKDSKYFDCDCKRCADPTELGSHFSTLICRVPGCGGFMLCQNPLASSTSPWACLKCGGALEGEQVRQEQEHWEKRLEATLSLIPDQENLLAELLEFFHPRHNLCIDVMFNLVPLYGIRGDETKDLLAEAARKEELCDGILFTMDRIIPGGFRMRGMLLVEHHISKLFLLRNRLECNEITKPQYMKKVASLRGPLAEAVAILGFEPEGSLEASRLTYAEKYLADLDLVLATVENSSC